MKHQKTSSAFAVKIVIMILALVYFGCSEDLNPIEPSMESDSFAGSHPFYVDSHSLTLPSPKEPTGKFVESGEIYSETMLINGDSTKEQKFETKIKYTAVYGQEIELKSKLTFPTNSFSGKRNVTQKLYADHFEVIIEGNPELNEPVEVDVKVKGPDFTGYEEDNLEFYYKNDSGEWVTPEYKEIKLKAKTKGEIEVKEALMTDLDYFGFSLGGPDWLALPPLGDELEPSDGVLFFEGVEIDGEKGGKIKISGKYFAADGSKIEVKSELKFPKGAFSGKRVITQKIHTKYGYTEFQPAMNFDVPAEYKIEIKGINLDNVNLDELTYIYMLPNGEYEAVEYDQLKVEKEKKQLKAEKVKLHHFSRYGFVK